LIGFIIQVFGTLVFNEVIVLPFWGFNKNLTLKENKWYDKLVDDSPAYESLEETQGLILQDDSRDSKLLKSW